jgi:hypothetical protein
MTAKLCREQAALSTCSPAAFGRADVDRAHRCPAAKVVDAAGIHHPYAVVESLADLRRSQCGNLAVLV